MATRTMVAKFSSRRLEPTLPGLMRYLASAVRPSGILDQQLVAVVVEVADERHADAEVVELAPDERHGRAAASLLTVMRTSSLPAWASAATCSAVASASAVSVLVIDWTTTGASPADGHTADIDARVCRRRLALAAWSCAEALDVGDA